MSRVTVVVVVLLLLAAASVTGCASGCPTAVLEGTLVAADGELVVERDLAGVATNVQWPFGIGVREDGGQLVLSDVVGSVKAREGDVVTIAGSSTADGTWVGCGDVTITGASTPKDPTE